jgi:hypothetical protein
MIFLVLEYRFGFHARDRRAWQEEPLAPALGKLARQLRVEQVLTAEGEESTVGRRL